jgi:hypothetical protein
MDALTAFGALFLLFAGWVFVGVLNVFLLHTHSLNEPFVTLGVISWFLSGPTWSFLFLRWRGKRSRAASKKMQEELLSKTREHLKNHSVKD